MIVMCRVCSGVDVGVVGSVSRRFRWSSQQRGKKNFFSPGDAGWLFRRLCRRSNDGGVAFSL